MLLVLIKLILTNLKEQMLVDSIASHETLDFCGIHIFVGPDHISDVILVSSPSECFLDSLGCVVAQFYQREVVVTPDDLACYGLNYDSGIVFLYYLPLCLELDQQLFVSQSLYVSL